MPIGPRDTLSNQLEQLEAEMISLGYGINFNTYQKDFSNSKPKIA